MRITCPDCRKPTTITHRVPLTDSIADLYCTCKHCGARAVFNLAFKQHAEPGQASAASIAAALLSLLPEEERRKLFQDNPGLLRFP